jgi:hypothetical protein
VLLNGVLMTGFGLSPTIPQPGLSERLIALAIGDCSIRMTVPSGRRLPAARQVNRLSFGQFQTPQTL